MKVQVVKYEKAGTQRIRRYRQTDKGREYEARNTARLRKVRASAIPEFIGVDSEGIGKGKNHRAVLLGVGANQYTARDLTRGLQYGEVFEFLYGQYREHPKAAFVGFYLSYDFNQWLRSLPVKAAAMLLTKEGRASRKMPDTSHNRRHSFPVRVDGWEIDMLGFKRLSIRPRPEGCECYEHKTKCTHKQYPWMHICDAGPFFQMSFLKVLDRTRWKDEGEGWPVTQEEYDLIEVGKNKRANAHLNDEMKFYNQLENEILSRVMKRLAAGFSKVGIRLSKDQWYGPGASASKWLQQKNAVKKQALVKGKTPLMRKWFWEACKWSYFGGWFEIFSHGLIYGSSWNYDINNAYPFATTKLPHICGQCRYRRGTGTYKGSGEFVLLYATVFTKGSRIGAMPYRDKHGGILRPGVTKGWYWRHELDASTRAGLVKKVTIHEWRKFVPCSPDRPFNSIHDLYNLRISVGKNSAQGMAIKLNNNSLYGKFAQSVGESPFNNWLYASYITSYCRTQILDAIATHPDKADAVLMVATDGICFDSPHPTLPVSDKLGEWEQTEYKDLCLFKPGVYWHHEGKEALLKVKSRGVPKDAFMHGIAAVEYQFYLVHTEGSFPGHKIEEKCIEIGEDVAIFRSEKGWPFFRVPVTFRMKSCAQALNEGQWGKAGMVEEEVYVRQDSDPQSKRRAPRYNFEKRRIDTLIHDLPVTEIQTWYHGEVKRPKRTAMGFGFEGEAMAPLLEAATALREKAANYDLPINNEEWEQVW